MNGVYKELKIGDKTEHGNIVRSERIRELQLFCQHYYDSLSEVLLIINKNYGWIWETIPDARIDELRLFLSNFAKCRYKLIDPELYKKVRAHCNKNKLAYPYGYLDNE